MSPRSFRPRLEELDARCLPSANISISDVTLAEGNSGQMAYVFTVSLSEASSKQVSVKYGTANGTAKTGNGDFVGKSGTLTFAPGEMTKTVTVMVNGDTTVEMDEWFFVNLSRARNAVIADAQGVGTILNDDDGSGSGGGCNPSVPCDPLPPPPEEWC
jgi:Calx-beta domain